LVSMLGLLALAVSLAGGGGEGAGGSTAEILLWLGATGGAAVVALGPGRRFGSLAVAEGVAGGFFFSIGDISVKVATQGGARAAFAIGVVVGYSLGTAFLQLGYQKGGALTVAGLATLLTNALPIAAGTVALGEPVPSGVFGGVRILAFAAVTLGAILLARPDRGPPAPRPAGGPRRQRAPRHFRCSRPPRIARRESVERRRRAGGPQRLRPRRVPLTRFGHPRR